MILEVLLVFLKITCLIIIYFHFLHLFFEHAFQMTARGAQLPNQILVLDRRYLNMVQVSGNFQLAAEFLAIRLLI